PDAGAAGRAVPWSEPADIEAPLIGEAEGERLLTAIGEELAGELPAARLVGAVLEDGSSRSRLTSSRGVDVAWRSRVALLHLEAECPAGAVAVDLAAREARRFGPGAIARRLADRLALVDAPPPAGFAARDRGELLLAPPLVARLLAALTPYLVGRRAVERMAALRDRRGRVGSAALTVVDDGRFPGGLLATPCDGEGVTTRAVTLVEQGVFRQPLVAWYEARDLDARPSGCSRRPSWRDLPRPGPTHLYLAPSPGVAVADLLADLARGYYLLDAAGPVSVDLEAATFSLRVAGFAVQSGRAVAPAGGLVLAGAVGTLWRGVQAVARDLDFVVDDGLVGSPTVLVTGLELRPVAR
ncbi:MAG TPA: metallopeptidase TldD-related protein, partial [Thermoanaerobaculia bacterium]|nr:metallopeptidase TldD-related protein [Thermoanaerobaculia bacterium]